MQKERLERLHKMVQKLKCIDVIIDPQEVLDVVGYGTPGRLHLAEVIWKKGYVENIYESFDKYIGCNKPAYVHKKRLTAYEAMKLISDAGGVPVLAHPYKIHEDFSIHKLINDGLQGVEVIYPTKLASLKKEYTNLAKEYDLAITGGTDFHGARKPSIKLGDVTISEELVTNLKERCPVLKRR